MPQAFEWGFLVLLLGSSFVILLVQAATMWRWACVVMAISSFGLICFDQHRLQPWAWQFLLVAIVLGSAEVATARAAWRWLVIGIYAWSAWSKLEQGFFVQHGPFLLEGFFKSIGLTNSFRFWPENTRYAIAAMIPVFELLVACGLSWSRTRRIAFLGAAFMHVGLLLALGPLGHQHRPGVLVWNLFFLVQNWILFFRGRVERTNAPLTLALSPADRGEGIREDAVAGRTVRVGNSLAWVVVIAALIWPAFESFGFCDHWPAWAVYAAKPERVTVSVHEDELLKLPETLKKYLGQQTVADEWHPLRIDRWSLDAVYVPLYPQDRFQVGVALGLVRDFELEQLRIVIEGPANWRTGKRVIHEFVGLDSIESLANSYRCGAQPR